MPPEGRGRKGKEDKLEEQEEKDEEREFISFRGEGRYQLQVFKAFPELPVTSEPMILQLTNLTTTDTPIIRKP